MLFRDSPGLKHVSDLLCLVTQSSCLREQKLLILLCQISHKHSQCAIPFRPQPRALSHRANTKRTGLSSHEGFVGRGSSCVCVCWCVCAVEEAACWCVRCVDVATRRWQHLCVCARVRVCTWVLRPAPPRGGWWSWSRSRREVCRVGGRR